jgi:hypothetical protein
MVSRHQRSDGLYVVTVNRSYELLEDLGGINCSGPIGHGFIFSQGDGGTRIEGQLLARRRNRSIGERQTWQR